MATVPQTVDPKDVRTIPVPLQRPADLVDLELRARGILQNENNNYSLNDLKSKLSEV